MKKSCLINACCWSSCRCNRRHQQQHHHHQQQHAKALMKSLICNGQRPSSLPVDAHLGGLSSPIESRVALVKSLVIFGLTQQVQQQLNIINLLCSSRLVSHSKFICLFALFGIYFLNRNQGRLLKMCPRTRSTLSDWWCWSLWWSFLHVTLPIRVCGIWMDNE